MSLEVHVESSYSLKYNHELNFFLSRKISPEVHPPKWYHSYTLFSHKVCTNKIVRWPLKDFNRAITSGCTKKIANDPHPVVHRRFAFFPSFSRSMRLQKVTLYDPDGMLSFESGSRPTLYTIWFDWQDSYGCLIILNTK